MSDALDFGLMGIENRYQTNQAQKASDEYVSWRDEQNNKKTGTTDLSFEDMLLLMVTQFQNQSIDNQADTNDMMNQLIQMTVMQAVTAVTQSVEELTTANVMSYSASLVGKEVTLGIYDENGDITEKVGVVQGTGTYNGAQVIFVDGESYFLSSIMGVGRLPKLDGSDKPEGGDGDKTEGDDKTEGGDKVEGGENAGGSTDSTEGAENSGAAGETSGASGSEGSGTKDTDSGETEVAGNSGTDGI